jgi:hypothetical protein
LTSNNSQSSFSHSQPQSRRPSGTGSSDPVDFDENQEVFVEDEDEDDAEMSFDSGEAGEDDLTAPKKKKESFFSRLKNKRDTKKENDKTYVGKPLLLFLPVL